MTTLLVPFLSTLLRRIDRPVDPGDESGFSTAELLGNAALGIAALVAIWAVLQVLGMDVVNWIRGQIFG